MRAQIRFNQGVGFCLDGGDDGGEELLARPCIAGCAGAAAHAVLGGLGPCAGSTAAMR